MVDVAQKLQESFDTWLAAVQAVADAEPGTTPETINVDLAFNLWLGTRMSPEDAYNVLAYMNE